MGKKYSGRLQLFIPSVSINKFITTIIFLFVLQINANTILAAGGRDIKGYVRDSKSGEALVFANVGIKDTYRGAVTNNEGYFVIVNPPAQVCTLIVSYIGYKTKEIVVDNSQELGTLQVMLQPTDFITDEVTVVGEAYTIWKSNEGVSQVTVSPKQIAILPNIGDVDIFRSLQLLPGISGISDGSSGLYIRGGTPDQNLVMLDGMTVYHVDHFFGFFSAFNAGAVKDVQVFKGGFPAKYGGRLSSVVNLTGKTGNVNDFKLSLGANLLSANAVAEIPLFDKGSFLISFRRSYADFIESSFYNTINEFLTGSDQQQGPQMSGGRFNQATQTILPSFYFYDLNAKITYPFSDKSYISFSFYNGEDYLDESTDPADFNNEMFGIENNMRMTNDDVTNWGNLGASLKWSNQWSDRLYSNVLFATSSYFNKRNRESGMTATTTNDTSSVAGDSFKMLQDNNINDYTFRVDNEWTLNSNHKLEFGLWLSSIGTDYQFITNDSIEVVNRDAKARQLSFYAQDNILLLKPLDITAGLRGTHFNGTNKFYFEPRLSMIYPFLDNFKLKASWGQYYQFINHITNEDVIEGARDFWLVADEELPPGFASHYILGIEYENDDYLFSIESYYKDLENLVEFNQRVTRRQGPFVNQAENYENSFYLGDGTAKGIEFLIQKKMGNFNGWVSYTLGNVEYVFPDFDEGDPFPASHDRKHEVKLVSTYTIGRWNFAGAWVYASGKAYTAPESQYFIEMLDGSQFSYIHVSDKNSYRLPDYHRLDLSVAYKFKNKSMEGEFGLSIFNLYNNKNVWYKEYDLSVSPIVITDVTMLGITPTVFIKMNF